MPRERASSPGLAIRPMSLPGSGLTLPVMPSDERGGAAYAAAAVAGDLRAAPRLDGGSLWATAARAYRLLHGDGDLDAAHRLLVDALDGGADQDDGPEALAAALDTLLMVCRFADREALWSPYRALAASHAARVTAPPDPTAQGPTAQVPTAQGPTEQGPTAQGPTEPDPT